MFHSAGIHHVTAIAGDPQENLDFYTRVLGLRLVKLTVNYDDPGTYHFYFGDASGRPGTIMTTFPWPGAHPGRKGNGQVTAIAYSIAPGSLVYWQKRLASAGVNVQGPFERFGQQVVAFSDPHGLPLEMTVDEGRPRPITWDASDVPADHQLGYFHGVSLSVRRRDATLEVLNWLGFATVGEEGERTRVQADGHEGGTVVDVVERPDDAPGTFSSGTVHHVAFRVPDADEQLRMRQELLALGFSVSPVMDRSYFRSIYFREPGGVLFEIATDPPGFAVDEPAEELGTRLCLPAKLEPSRSELEGLLPPLRLTGDRG